MSWQPSASLINIRARAEVLAKIRAFFAARDVLEVETPLLTHSTIPDPNIASFKTTLNNKNLYLQTSPEFAMKRLLASGTESIYQICKAFRYDESGKLHNPEFTMLEWYRVDFDHHALMQEMDALLHALLQTKPAEKITYQESFQKHLNIDPLNCSLDDLRTCAQQNGLNDIPDLDKDGWLNILLIRFIEPHLGFTQPTFIYNFPKSQAALARINDDVAERFEVYINGVELANGFHELSDTNEQRQRFIADLKKRAQLKLEQPPLDEYFLQALANNFPNCSGVALGIDRLLMLYTKTKAINEVIAFTIDNC
ncbi:MAG: elongation factor P--(R)-beta-lysine ligase [Gammaproteobacteria bacterium]|nr:elongation factor P--(R)-beta-lysine ligase [Gammaproteobacteria bacterium]